MTQLEEDWTDTVVDVSKLKLDLQNPRLPRHVKDHNDENQIRNHLLEKEEIKRIAKSIASNGYHRSATSIAYKDQDHLVVLDGNRRLAACQLLADPSLVPNSKDRKEFEDLAQNLGSDTLSSIKVTVAPSRKAAEKEIWDIHVTPLSKPWEVLQKLRMYRNLIDTGDFSVKTAAQEYGLTENKFKYELARLYFYERLTELTDEKGEEELLKSGFNKIHRLILSNNGKKLLRYSVDDRGEVIAEDKNDFESKLKAMEPYITNRGLVRAQSSKDDLERDVYSSIDPKAFPQPQKQGHSAQRPSQQSKLPIPTPTPKPATTSAKPDWVTNSDYATYNGSNRVKSILGELRKNQPQKNQNINMAAVTLRVVIELAIYDKLSSRGSIAKIINDKKAAIAQENAKRAQANKPLMANLQPDWAPSLKEMLAFMSKEANGIITDPQERKALAKLTTSQSLFVSDLDNFIHNHAFVPTEDMLRDIWNAFGRLVFDVLKKL